MTYFAFSVFDTIDSCYGDILLHRSEARAARTLLDSIRARNEQLKQKGMPLIDINELKLRRIGTFDDATGRFSALENPVEISLDI